MIIKKRLFLTLDGKVVDETSSSGAFLLAAAGQEIPDAEAIEHGLVDGGLPPEQEESDESGSSESKDDDTSESEPAADKSEEGDETEEKKKGKPEDKNKSPTENKQIVPPENKGEKKSGLQINLADQ